MRQERMLLIDHYDSFTHTIKSYFNKLNVHVDVIQYDDPRLLDLERLMPTMLVFSPGPGHPRDVPSTVELIKKYHTQYPMLGICLGIQCMAYALGGRIMYADEVMHGMQSVIHHDGTGIFKHVPSFFSATRYHSLVVDPGVLSSDWRITAWTQAQDGPRVIMGLAHKNYPVYGVQYHPEAILTEHGYLLFQNFLTAATRWRNRAC